MKRTKTLSMVTVLAVTASTAVYQFSSNAPAQAQSAARGQAAAQQNGRTFEARFWDWLHPQYKNWAPWPGQDEDFYEGQAPHGALLKMYVNRKAAANPGGLPHGSVIVKENYSPDENLKSVTVMYRSENYDPDHYDWYWVKYNPDGTVAKTPPDKGSKPIAGKFQSCIQCHSGAGGNDFAFANDQ